MGQSSSLFRNRIGGLQDAVTAPVTATTAATTAAPTMPAIPIPGGGPAELAPSRGDVSTTSRIDPALAPYLQLGLRRAENLFFGPTQPSLYPGQMYAPTSAQTERALTQQEALAGGMAPIIGAGQQAYLSSLGQLGQTAAGGFLTGSPYREAMIQAATRPLVQQYSEQVVPGIASGFSRAGRYGSGAMEQAQARAAEAFGRSLGDVSAGVAAQDYARERALQQQAQTTQAALGQAAPSFYQASFLPSQALAQVGAARETIAQRPITEAMQRYQFAQELPYRQLQGFLGSVYGSPMAASQYQPIPQAQTNPLGQALGGAALGYLGGSLFPGSTFGISNQYLGAGLGGLAGLLL